MGVVDGVGVSKREKKIEKRHMKKKIERKEKWKERKYKAKNVHDVEK